METPADRTKALAWVPLETFLVEWKHRPVPYVLLVAATLETFLVEWKLGDTHPSVGFPLLP